jgi:chloramphenicol 3-O-phosphotransferase
MTKPTTIHVSSNEIRSAFERSLTDGAGETRFVILEGLTGSGKTTLTERPFALGTRHSVNIELDSFLRRPVSETTPYIDAIDRAALDAAVAAVDTSPIVIVQGAIGWPLVQSVTALLEKDFIRGVYLKRMWRLRPDFLSG